MFLNIWKCLYCDQTYWACTAGCLARCLYSPKRPREQSWMVHSCPENNEKNQNKNKNKNEQIPPQHVHLAPLGCSSLPNICYLFFFFLNLLIFFSFFPLILFLSFSSFAIFHLLINYPFSQDNFIARFWVLHCPTSD